MKLLLDQGLPRTAAELLNRAGIDTTHVGEIGYAAAEDDMILQLGRNEGYVIVTLDSDFHIACSDRSDRTFGDSYPHRRTEGQGCC